MRRYIKIAIGGNGAVGKTSLVKRYLFNTFNNSEPLTTGIDLFDKKIKINRKKYNLIIWDLGGQDRFKNLHSLCKFTKGSIGAMLLFDLHTISSIDHLEFWHNILIEHNILPILIVGTKLDITQKYITSIDQMIASFLNEHSSCFGYLKTSAKNNININSCFEILINRIICQMNIPEIKEKYFIKP